MRRGFSLLAAIFFVVVTSSLCMLALSLSNTTSRQTSEIYLREQAELLAQGATEYAVLEILNHDFKSKGCLSSVKGNFKNDANPILTYEVDITYFGNIGTCAGIPVQSKESAGTVMLDVFVKSYGYDESDRDKMKTPNSIAFHKRTLQKL
ncbi:MULTISPECIES: hypothetical protein [Campylobacter]|uniref:hypothetical protein n=1 Tax=Campylobacter TaxID=194 RepID=UPI0019D279F0|nr:MULTISPECIES: hypothetical protein [Campylobacter]MBN7287660.1 hypothetical protein [Campylobacter curvus]MDU6826469.1 hypothetical protein [Campylobacter sp.]